MKIAYLFGSLNRGGTETLLLDVFRNAAHNKLDAIGVYRKSGNLETDFIQSGVTMYKIPVSRNRFTYLVKLRRFFVGNDVTVVHAQQPIDALYARLACLGTGVKIVQTLHGYDFTNKKSEKCMLRHIIKRTDTNIFVSNSQRKYYQQKYSLNPGKQQVVYNGISFDKLNAFAHQTTLSLPMSNLREELNITPDVLLLGTVGNFNSVRNQIMICRFLKELKAKKISFHFVFVGGMLESNPQKYSDCIDFCNQNDLEKNVSFLGSRNDVPDILKQLDAFVYATDHDTFGLAVVEAMAVGIPVFVNDWEVMTEITDSGKYATLYKSDDEVDLLQQFMVFLQDKEAYKDKAREAACFVSEKYSIEKHIENLKQVYSLD